MTKLRTLGLLQDAMAKEFAWRKKELHNLKLLVMSNEKTHNRNLCIRAAVTILYAHWEGFVKEIGTMYLEFVARQGMRHDEPPLHFLALAVHGRVHDAMVSNKIKQCRDLVEFFRDKSGEVSRLNWRSGIRTHANLKSAVFEEIVTVLGLDYSRFATKEKLLDEQLLQNRNSIAHGQQAMVSYDEYIDLHDEMLTIMQDFYNQVDNAAYTGGYRRT
jgi:hypothetical protein